MGKIPKKKSKRILLKDKNKIARKVRQHHKKQRREAKKNPNKFKHKDPGIPNSWPFKQELLAEQEQARTDEREMHARARAHKEVLKQRAANQKDARLQRSRPSAKQLRDESVSSALAAAHALVLVLDARDPPAGRCARLEQLFTESADADAAPRALVVALNHAHLVPADNLAGWLLALQRDGVCAVPYCAVADEAALAKSGKGTSRQIALKAAGATELCDLLARIAAEPALAAARADKAGGKAAKAAAAVAPLKVVVAGAPGSGVADVRATLALRLKKKGPARGLVEVVETFVSLEPRLAADGCNLPHANPTAGVLSFGLRPSRKATDLVQLAGALLERCADQSALTRHYSVPKFKSAADFLRQLAAALQLPNADGTDAPDPALAALAFLEQWRLGRVPFCAQLPKPPPSAPSASRVSRSKSPAPAPAEAAPSALVALARAVYATEATKDLADSFAAAAAAGAAGVHLVLVPSAVGIESEVVSRLDEQVERKAAKRAKGPRSAAVAADDV